jgi:hypothetical protein
MVAWHEVPGTSGAMNPSRRVRFESVAGHRRLSDKVRATSLFTGENLAPYPNGTYPWVRLSQALRARLPSACPSGTEAHHPGSFQVIC